MREKFFDRKKYIEIALHLKRHQFFGETVIRKSEIALNLKSYKNFLLEKSSADEKKFL